MIYRGEVGRGLSIGRFLHYKKSFEKLLANTFSNLLIKIGLDENPGGSIWIRKLQCNLLTLPFVSSYCRV